MTLYLTKVWGFSPPIGPLQFSTEGWRDRARSMIKPGDEVLLVGTKGERTAEADRGRLLGLMLPTTEPVMSADFDLEIEPHDFDEQGAYRWPYGLHNIAAWQLLDRPLLSEISSQTFTMDSAQGIVELTEDEASRVRNLRRQEVPLLPVKIRAAARLVGEEVARKRSSPPPSTHRRGVMHMRNAPAYTYALKLDGCQSPAFKIGWAFEYRQRARQFNQASMPELGGLAYKECFHQLWDTARLAYFMEQRVLDQFPHHRHRANHEIIVGADEAELVAAWGAAFNETRTAARTKGWRT